MKLVNVLRKECIAANVKIADKASALLEVARVAKKSSVLKNVEEQEILEKLQERETLGSTGFGGGIAIPHCRLKSVTDFVIGIITVDEGVEYDALDGEPVKLMVFIIAPDTESDKHVRLLSAISQALLVPGAVKEILAGKASEAIFESFMRFSRADIDAADRTSKNMFRIFVQDDEVFHKIVEVLTMTEYSSLVVMDAENIQAYLAKMPLFAGIWSDKHKDFCKLILAVVEKKLTNETLRRIEGVTGNLDECSGVMVTVQELVYCAGSLEK